MSSSSADDSVSRCPFSPRASPDSFELSPPSASCVRASRPDGRWRPKDTAARAKIRVSRPHTINILLPAHGGTSMPKGKPSTDTRLSAREKHKKGASGNRVDANRVGISGVDKTIHEHHCTHPIGNKLPADEGNRRAWKAPFRAPGGVGCMGGREKTMWGIWLRHQPAHLRWSAAHLSGAGPSNAPGQEWRQGGDFGS